MTELKPTRRTGQLRRIIELGTALQLNRNVDALLQEIVESARLSLGFKVITLNVYNPVTHLLTTKAHTGLDEEGRKTLEGTSYPMEELTAVMQDTFRVGRCYFIPNGALDWDRYFPEPMYNPLKDTPKNGDPNAWHPDDALFVPIETMGCEGKFYGLLWADHPADGQRPNQQTFEILEYYAAAAAVALENARLLQESRQSAARLEALHIISQEIVRVGNDPEKIYAAIHKSAARLMQCDAILINLVDEARSQLQAVYAIDKGSRLFLDNMSIDQGLSGYVVRKDESLFFSDMFKVEKLPVKPVRVAQTDPCRSMLVAPMRLGKQVIGTISVQSYDPDVYTREDLRLLEMFASYVAIALDNARLFQRLDSMATTDDLTGLYNRRRLFELGSKEYVRALRYHKPLTALVLDMDHFKTINDTFGHRAGDQVLVELAGLLKVETRTTDILARYGGEEFAVLFLETNLAEAWEAAERIRLAISSWLFAANGSKVHLTSSIGLASLSSAVKDFDDLLTQADQALYQAKHEGRNRVVAMH